MITCEHTSNSNNYIDPNLMNEDELNGELTNDDNSITNNSLHNNEIGLNQKRQFVHNHISNINSDLKAKPPTSLFIYPNLVYICEVYKGNRLIRNVTTTLNSRRNNNSTLFGKFNFRSFQKKKKQNLIFFFNYLLDMNGNIEFSVNGLQPASMYQIKIYAKNSKGNSRHIQLKAETLRPAERLIDSFNLDSVFASDSISGNEGFGQLSSNSDDTNALTNDASNNLDLTSDQTNSNVLNSELLSARNTRSMFGFTNGKPMLLVLLSSITLVSLIIVALGVAVILRVKRVHGRMNSNSSSSLGGRTSNSNSQSINETSTNTVNTSCSTGELLTNKSQIVSSKSQNSSPANHHQYQLTNNNLIHSSALNPNSTLSRQSQNQLLKRQSITNSNSLLIHSSPQKLLQNNGTSNLIPNASTGILTTALPGITDDCCCEDDYCEELRMVSSVITEQQQQQRALIAQHQLDQQQLYQSLINSGKAPNLISSYAQTNFNNYENTNKQFITYGEFEEVLKRINFKRIKKTNHFFVYSHRLSSECNSSSK